MKPKPLEEMSKEELIILIKEVNGLVGAVDGDTLKHLRKFIQKYNELDWKYQNVKQRIKSAVQGLLEEIKIEKERYKEIKEVISGLSIAEELIKKWLADVVSEKK